MKNKFTYLAILLAFFITGCFEKRKAEIVTLDKNIIPEYNKIVFASKRNENKSIYSMMPNGSHIKQLTNGIDDSEPSWSPDRRYVAFSRKWMLDGEVFSEIFVMNADGSGLQRLTNHFLTSRGPVWSPDGRFIAYYVWNTTNWEIFIISLRDGAVRNLTSDPRTQTYPSWSPDGKKILYHQDEGNGDWNIYQINVDGSNKKQLTSNNSANWLPAWSPDGKQISFWSHRTGNWEAFLMNNDGKNQRKITDAINHNLDSLCKLVWSPDGKELAIMADVKAGSSDIVRFNIKNHNFERITNSSTKDYCLDWSH